MYKLAPMNSMRPILTPSLGMRYLGTSINLIGHSVSFVGVTIESCDNREEIYILVAHDH